MRRFHVVLPLLAILFPTDLRSASDDGIREPAVAGQFYPAEPAELRETVTSLLRTCRKQVSGAPFVLVCPHAGYFYSGKVAAEAFTQAAGNRYDLVVVLGTNHTVPGFSGAAVFKGKGFRTPLGIVAVDQAAADKLLASDPVFTERDAAHRSEHSIEVQLPFLQVLFPGIPILPVVIGTTVPGICERIGRNLARLAAGKLLLVVASSDLSHYPDYESAARTDRKTLELIVSGDGRSLHRYLAQVPGSAPSLVTGACGEGPILAGMAAAKDAGIGKGELLAYANSGDVLPESRSRVVGYGAVAFTAGDASAASEAAKTGQEPFSLDASTRQALLCLARESIRRQLSPAKGGLPPAWNGTALMKAGAFVTLRKNGALRGCIGRLEPDLPLQEVVSRYAVYAATEDSRFDPVTITELPELEIEISALSPPSPVPGFTSIQVGRDGVVLSKGGHSATFLPQVAGEQRWGRGELLSNLCLKAGLPGECWKEGARFDTYQATVFSESDFRPEKQR